MKTGYWILMILMSITPSITFCGYNKFSTGDGDQRGSPPAYGSPDFPATGQLDYFLSKEGKMSSGSISDPDEGFECPGLQCPGYVIKNDILIGVDENNPDFFKELIKSTCRNSFMTMEMNEHTKKYPVRIPVLIPEPEVPFQSIIPYGLEYSLAAKNPVNLGGFVCDFLQIILSNKVVDAIRNNSVDQCILNEKAEELRGKWNSWISQHRK